MVIAGHNGAGKSTCYRKYLRDATAPYINYHIDPDAVEQEIRAEWEGEFLAKDEFSRLAQDEANQRRKMYLDTEVNFSFETVLSDPFGDKVRFLEEARRRGYVVALLAVGLDSPGKSAERVARRVARGGHDVPIERIRARYPRVLANIVQGIQVASLALVVDNSEDNLEDDTGAYSAFALFAHGSAVVVENDAPPWWRNIEH